MINLHRCMRYIKDLFVNQYFIFLSIVFSCVIAFPDREILYINPNNDVFILITDVHTFRCALMSALGIPYYQIHLT